MTDNKFAMNCVKFELEVLEEIGKRESGNVLSHLGDIFAPIIIDIITQMTEGNNKWTKDTILVAGDFAHDLSQQIYMAKPEGE